MNKYFLYQCLAKAGVFPELAQRPDNFATNISDKFKIGSIEITKEVTDSINVMLDEVDTYAKHVVETNRKAQELENQETAQKSYAKRYARTTNIDTKPGWFGYKNGFEK